MEKKILIRYLNFIILYYFNKKKKKLIGEKSLYTKLGDFLRQNGYVTVIPNYTQFPYGRINGMVEDIHDAILWVYQNIHKYHGNPMDITILAHSSGAHVSMLTLIKAALKVHDDYVFKYVDPLPIFKRVVLLNGPYDFDVFTELSKKSGVTEENSNFEKFASTVLGSDCPTDILKGYKDKSIATLGSNEIRIIHTTGDTMVPISSATGLLDQIKRTSNIKADLYIGEGFYHCGITEGVMNDVADAQKFLLKVLRD